ncbi:type II toxin-antitoxin system ParD family antitoxin [Methylobacterium sp. E-005]|nr:type II toxin-antitoxin system ParD family antitoxin [Methylobacterium sp. E-005]
MNRQIAGGHHGSAADVVRAGLRLPGAGEIHLRALQSALTDD